MTHSHFKIPTDHGAVSMLTHGGTAPNAPAYVESILAACDPADDTDSNRYAQALAVSLGLPVQYGDDGPGNNIPTLSALDPSSWPGQQADAGPTGPFA